MVTVAYGYKNHRGESKKKTEKSKAATTNQIYHLYVILKSVNEARNRKVESRGTKIGMAWVVYIISLFLLHCLFFMQKV